jgi:O-antigen/teichoic acid export membrane protein
MATLTTSPVQRASSVAEARKFRREMGQISRQSGVFLTGTLFTTAAAYFFKIYLARVLGAEALGIYVLGMTVGGVLGVLAALGLPQASARYVAVYGATGRIEELRGFLWGSAAALLVSNTLVAAVMIATRHWIALRFYHTPSLAQYMVLFAAIMFLGTFTTFLGQVLAGYKDVAVRTVITNFIGSPLTIILSVCLLALGAGLRGYIAAQVVSSLVVLALMAGVVWRLTPRMARPGLTPLPRFENEALCFSASLFAVQGLEYVLAQLDKILLGFYTDARQVGIYTVAVALTAFLPLGLQSINQIFSPTIADLHARGDADLLGRLYRTLARWVLGLTLPVAIVVCTFAPQLMAIFGSEFRIGWPVLVIGALGQLINCAVGSVGLLLIMSGNQNKLIRVQVKVTMATVILGLVFIPAYGIVGAAVVSAASNAAINLLNLREVRSTLRLSPSLQGYVRLAGAALPALALVLLLRSQLHLLHSPALTILLSIALAYAVFLAITFLFGLDDDDRLVIGAVQSRLRQTFWKVAEAA